MAKPKIFVRYIGVFEIWEKAKCPLLSDGFTPYPTGQQQNVRYSGFVRYFRSPLNWSFTVPEKPVQRILGTSLRLHKVGEEYIQTIKQFVSRFHRNN